MNSNITLTVLNLHQQTDPKVQQDFKGQYSKVKGQSVVHYDVAHLKPSTNVFLHLLRFPRYSPDQVL